MAETTVTHVSFSSNGDWMATVDVRDDQIGQSSLKFWYWDKPTQQYELNTQFYVNRSERIRALVYHPKRERCITVSADGQFKVWTVRLNKQEASIDASKMSTKKASGASSTTSSSNQHHNIPHQRVEVLEGSAKYRWTMEAAASYRDLEPRSACFSSDGSLLAISYHHLITLWNPDSNMLLTTLSYPPDHEPITKLSFLGDSHFLVACSRRRLFLWDLLTCQLKWSHVVSADILAVDPKSSKFAIYSPIASTDWSQAIQNAADEQSAEMMREHGNASGNASRKDETLLSDSGTVGAVSNGMDVDDTDTESVKSVNTQRRAPIQVSGLAKKVKTDGYIILFSPASPAPLGLWVMPALGVRGISFLPSRTGGGGGGGGSTSSSFAPSRSSTGLQSSLVYLNGQHEFKFLLSDEDASEEVAPPTPSSSASLSASGSHLPSSPSSSKTKKTTLLKNTLQLQQQFIAKINATKLAEGPSVFTLMYGGSDSPSLHLSENAHSGESQLSATPQKPATGGVTLPKIATASKKAPLPKGGASSSSSSTMASHANSTQARQANQLTEQLLANLFQSDVQVIPPPSTLFPQFADSLIFKLSASSATPQHIGSTASTGISGSATPDAPQTSSASTTVARAPNSAQTAKPDDFKYVAPKKIAAAKLAHAELATEAKLLETEVASLDILGDSSQPGKSDLSFLDDFFSSIPIGLSAVTGGTSATRQKLNLPQSQTPVPSSQSPPTKKRDKSNLSTPVATTDEQQQGSTSKGSKKRKRSRSNISTSHNGEETSD